MKWIGTLILLFGVSLLSVYGSFIANFWTEKGRPYVFVRQPQSELPVSNRQSELCSLECKLDQNISHRQKGDFNVTSRESTFPQVNNKKEPVTLPQEIVLNFTAQDKRFLTTLDTAKLTHGVNLNVSPNDALQEKKKLQNSSRETRAPQSNNNLRSLPTTLYKLAQNVSFNERSLV